MIFSVVWLLAALMAPLASSRHLHISPNISPTSTSTSMMATLMMAMATMAPLASAQLRPPNLSPDNLPDTAFTCEDKVGFFQKKMLKNRNYKISIYDGIIWCDGSYQRCIIQTFDFSFWNICRSQENIILPFDFWYLNMHRWQEGIMRTWRRTVNCSTCAFKSQNMR